MANTLSKQNGAGKPLVLLIPGHAEGGTSDWMDGWEASHADFQRLDLGMWDKPHRNTWVNKLNLAIHQATEAAPRPVILVAHDIGCLAVAWWAEYEQPKPGEPVVGALLVAPPDVDRPGTDVRLASFGACPRQPLPFPSFLVSDSRSPQPQLVTATQLASDWDSHFTLDDIDEHGGEAARYLLTRMLRDHRTARPVLEAPRVVAAARREIAHV